MKILRVIFEENQTTTINRSQSIVFSRELFITQPFVLQIFHN